MTKKVKEYIEYEFLGKTRKFNKESYPHKLNKAELAEVRDSYKRRTPQGLKAARRNLYKVLTAPGLPNKISELYRYYFEDVAHDTRLYHCKWTVNELLQSDVLTQFFINRTRTNDKVFSGSLPDDFRTSLRIGGSGIATNPTNFPLGECLRVLKNYCPQGGGDVHRPQLRLGRPTLGGGEAWA